MNHLHSSRRATASGFTLIEVLIVVFMIAILMAIAAPSWLAYLTRQRMRAVQNDLAEVLRQAQTNAIQTRSEQRVTIDVDPDRRVPTVLVNGTAQILGSSNIPEGALTLSNSDESITFDYQGASPVADVPFVAIIQPDNGATTQRCVIVASLLGTVKAERDDNCDRDNLTDELLITNND